MAPGPYVLKPSQSCSTLLFVQSLRVIEPYQWLPCGVTWDSSRTVIVIRLLRTSALRCFQARASTESKALVSATHRLVVVLAAFVPENAAV